MTPKNIKQIEDLAVMLEGDFVPPYAAARDLAILAAELAIVEHEARCHGGRPIPSADPEMVKASREDYAKGKYFSTDEYLAKLHSQPPATPEQRGEEIPKWCYGAADAIYDYADGPTATPDHDGYAKLVDGYATIIWKHAKPHIPAATDADEATVERAAVEAYRRYWGVQVSSSGWGQASENVKGIWRDVVRAAIAAMKGGA